MLRGFSGRDLTWIAVAGVLGAGLRWLIADAGAAETGGGWFRYAPNAAVALSEFGLPWRTLIANLLGTAVLGVVVALRKRHDGRLLLAAGLGFCGSLTTFSTFAVETVQRLRGSVLHAPGSSSAETVTLIVDDAARTQGLGYVLMSVVAGCVVFLVSRGLTARVIRAQAAQ